MKAKVDPAKDPTTVYVTSMNDRAMYGRVTRWTLGQIVEIEIKDGGR